MLKVLQQHLTGLTFFALGLGLVVGLAVSDGMLAPTRLSEDDFIREVERGGRMAVIIRASNLSGMIGDRVKLFRNLNVKSLVLQDADVIVPDLDAASFLGCRQDKDVFFSGEVERKAEVYAGRLPDSPANLLNKASDGHVGAAISAVGAIYECAIEPQKGRLAQEVIGRGIGVIIPIHQSADNHVSFSARAAVVTYFDFFGNLFITFLLMLFIPTLAVSLLRAVLDSAGAVRKFAPAFSFFIVSSIVASLIGVSGGLALSSARADLDKEHVRTFAQALGGHTESVAYDPHPLLTQFARIVPTNPLGALSDPAGNSGLQIAFIAVILGAVLATLGSSTRTRISDSLKRALSVLIKDSQYDNLAISTYAEWAAPIGVFFLGVSTAAKMDQTALRDLGSLALTILVCLTVFAFLLLIWLRMFRDWRLWRDNGLKASLPGLVTAFATSSSYAALPQIASIPLVEGDSIRRGIMDFGFALNKSGTAVYIAASAGFVLSRFGAAEPATVLMMAVLCALSSTACAGLPFAAIFALRMVLAASGMPAGLAWLILPIDPIIDRFVTVINVFANICACGDKRRGLADEAKLATLPVSAEGGASGG